MKYRGEYRYTNEFNPRHQWSVVGRHGGVHLHITDMGEAHGKKYGDRHIGGIEIHYRVPPEYLAEDPPSHDHCWLLRSPCWHDGSSMQATEKWIPWWLAAPNDHDRMLAFLADELVRFTDGEQDTTLSMLAKVERTADL